jgi:hypothetical protein
MVLLMISGCQEKEVQMKTDDQGVPSNREHKKASDGQDWQESPLFKSGDFTMIGQEGRLGFIYSDREVDRFYPNQTQKYMWHFWGDDQEFDGELKVMATHENGGEPITVLEDLPLGGPNNGADRHVPSNMSLPKSGMWKLDAYIGDKLFGSVYVKVHEK